jgi:competence protein ComEC
MVLGVLVMLLAAFGMVPQFLSQCLEWTVLVLNKIIGWVASFEQFIFQDIPFNAYMLLGLYLFIIAVILWFEKPNFRKLSLALIALMLFQGSYFGSRWISQNQKEWIVFNVRKSTLIAERTGDAVTIFSNEVHNGARLLKPYLVANFCQIENQKPVQNLAYFNSKKIMLIDSTALYPKNTAPDVLVLRQSPKINLERMLQTVSPKMIVADASNYKSYVKLWKATCEKQKIPFHATAEKGFYKLQ